MEDAVSQNTRELQDLTGKIKSMSENVMQSNYEQLLYSISHEALDVSNELLRNAENLINGIFSSLHGSLDPALIRGEPLQRALADIKIQAERKHFKLPFDHQLNIFEFPTSFIYHENTIFDAISHIPLVNPAKQMQLYNLANFPLPISNISKNVFVREQKQHLLAVKNDRSSILELQSTDLDKCQRLGQYYFCSTLVERKSDPKGTCLAGIYRGQLEQIAENCHVLFSPKEERVQRVTAQLAFFHGPSQRVAILC